MASDPLELPTDRPRRAGRPADPDRLSFPIGAEVSGLAARRCVSRGAVCCAALLAVLYRYTGRTDLTCGLDDETGSRVLTVDVSDDPSFADLLTASGPVGDSFSVTVADLTVFFADGRMTVDYDRQVFDLESIERLCGHLSRVLDAAVARPRLRLSELPMLTGVENSRFDEWNDTTVDYPVDRSVVELIADQVCRAPDAVALVFDGAELSYAELDRRANRLANLLIERGVGAESTVAIYLDRSFDLVIALLAVLRAGAAYLPLDPSYPVARLSYLVSDGRAAVLLTHDRLADRQPEHDADVIWLDRLPPAGDEPPAVDAGLGRAAYVIYTSGSTGSPKGVVNTHRGLLNRLQWMQQEYRLTADDAVLQKTPCGFDVSVWEFFWPLMTGARLVIAKPDGHRDPHYLAELIATQRVTVLHFVPSMLHLFLDVADLSRCDSVRQVVCSGEALPVALQEKFFASGLRARLDNLYGPTEAAIDVTHWRCRAGQQRVPIGRPIANTTVHVLDRHGNRVPVGVPGELFLGGVQLARGYLNRPELTEERFRPDPFSSVPGARLYATGDLARWRPDGALEYLGRMDHQVKLRGFRIELGEIEVALTDCPGVHTAVVLLREDPEAEPMLVAHLVADRVSVDALRGALADRLPEYMVPTAYLFLDEIPLSANGKVDRTALLAMSLPLASAGPYRPPRTELERQLAEIWAQTLNVAVVGVDDNFFDLGGHSLSAVRMLAVVAERLRVRASLPSLFRAPTIATFAAEVLAGGRSGEPPAPRRRGSSTAPLSPAQRRLWFLHQLFGDMPAYHLPLAFQICGPLDLDALRWAITEVVARHEVLRSAVVDGPDRPMLSVRPPSAIPLPVTEVAEITDDLLRARLRVPFDLDHGPMLRAEVFRTAADVHVVLITVHHLVADEWSLGVITGELSAGYRARLVGAPVELPPLPVQYGDYAWWQQENADRLDGPEHYWRGQLAGVEPLELPADRPRPAVQSFEGKRASVTVPAELMARLRTLGRTAGATDFMVMTAGLLTLLRRLTGQDDVAIGAVTADRGLPEFVHLAGFFVNTVVLRADLSGDPAFTEVLSRTRELVLDAFDHQDLPFERVVESVAPHRDISGTPLFGVALSYLNTPPVVLSLPEVEVRAVGFDPGTVRFDLDVFMRDDADGGIAIDVDYRTDLFDETTVRRLLGQYLTLLREAAAAPDEPVDRLVLCTAEERAELAELGHRAADLPCRALVPELIAEWAARTPDAPAVCDGRRMLSYAELNELADRLAGRLRSAEVGPDAIVGVLLPRSVEFVAALLAVLRSGAAYLPLDPSYPDVRLTEMLADSTAPLVITDARLADRLADPPALLLIDPAPADRAEPGRGRSDVEPGGGQPGDLAYVIYTSGSTGRPKGVLIEHRGLLNLCQWHNLVYQVTPADRGTMIAAQGFDASVWELWPYLAAGASVVIADEQTRSDPDALARWLIDQQATLTFLPTPMAEAIMDGDLVDQLPVRAVLTGGDQLRRRPRRDLPFALINHYGPTECTVVATAGEVAPQGESPIGIGRPIDNVEVVLLDASGLLAPRGARAELCLGGPQLARGYLGRPDLTDERFVPNPVGPAGSRLYRTGDLARWRNDGELEFLGRADRQLKIRGHRIEPGEIEARLREHPAVTEAIVLAQTAVTGDHRLVGYLTTTRSVDHDDLRGWLRERLPDYMIPVALVELGDFPMTPSGKIDRAGLPVPDLGSDAAERVDPRDDVERAVAELFGELLGTAPTGIRDDFFALGGHSLLAARLVARLQREFGVDLPVRAVFADRTVEALSVALVEAALAVNEPSL